MRGVTYLSGVAMALACAAGAARAGQVGGVSAPSIPSSSAAGQASGSSATSTPAPSGSTAGVPSAAAPPPVTVQELPSSPPLPQTTEGGRIGTFPVTPQPAPVSAPGVPSPSAPLPSAVPTTTRSGDVAPAGAAGDAAQPATGTQNGRPSTEQQGQGASQRFPAVSGPPSPYPVARSVPGEIDLVSAYTLGHENDPTYRAAIAEHDANRQTADQTITAYLPQASYSYNNIPTEGGARHVATVTQPIISIGGLATLKQRAPRRAYADATLQVREQDLATRTMTAVSDIIKANEAIALNDARIDAFRAQSERATKLYQAGQGTITDARDIEVRYEQALSNRILLKSDQIAAQARLRSIMGAPVPEGAFRLPEQFGPVELTSVDTYLQQQTDDNPQIEAARQTERINQLEARRIRGSIFPVLGASATYTRRSGVADSYVGVSVSAPLNAGSLFQIGAANASVRRSFEERRQVEDKARTELERLYALVDGGRQALAINAKAIEAAELSVEANTRSYEGGVRTSVDVVNAIQTTFEVKNAYVQAATTLAINYLNLQLLAGIDPADAMAATQLFLLGRR